MNCSIMTVRAMEADLIETLKIFLYMLKKNVPQGKNKVEGYTFKLVACATLTDSLVEVVENPATIFLLSEECISDKMCLKCWFTAEN